MSAITSKADIRFCRSMSALCQWRTSYIRQPEDALGLLDGLPANLPPDIRKAAAGRTGRQTKRNML